MASAEWPASIHHHVHPNPHCHRPASACFSLCGVLKLAAEVKPDAIILGGDFLHGTCLLPYGRTPQLTPTLCAVELHAIEAPLLFVRGNHEDENWFELRDAWKSLRTFAPVRLNGSFAMIGDIGVVGFPCAMGYEAA